MARNGSGTYSLPAGNPVVTGTTISSTWANNTLSDIATALTNSLAKDGQTTPTANLPMGTFKLTGLGAGSATTDSARFDQIFNQGAPTDIASAATVDIGAQLTNFLTVTGTTTITSFGTNYKGPKMLKFAGALALTYNATTLVIPGAASITTAAGDTCIVIPKSTSSGTADGWQVITYQRASGLPAAAGPNTDIISLGNNTSTIYTTSGTSTAYVITPNPAITSYSVGQSFVVNFNAASGTSPTLQINGIATPPNLVKTSLDGTYVNVAANDIQANHRSRVTLISATQALVEELNPLVSMVRLHSPPSGTAGYGTTNTKIRRFGTVVTNQGADITYADSVTLGATFTINVAGIYAISYTDQYTGADIATITLNDSTPTIAPVVADVLAGDQSLGANNPADASWTGYLASGSIIRARTFSGLGSGTTTAYGQFTISRVG